MNQLFLKVDFTGTPIWRRVTLLDCITFMDLANFVGEVFFSIGFTKVTHQLERGTRCTLKSKLSAAGLTVGDVVSFDTEDKEESKWKYRVTVEDIKHYTGWARDFEPVCYALEYPQPPFQEECRGRYGNDYVVEHWNDEYQEWGIPVDVNQVTVSLQLHWRRLYDRRLSALREKYDPVHSFDGKSTFSMYYATMDELFNDIDKQSDEKKMEIIESVVDMVANRKIAADTELTLRFLQDYDMLLDAENLSADTKMKICLCSMRAMVEGINDSPELLPFELAGAIELEIYGELHPQSEWKWGKENKPQNP